MVQRAVGKQGRRPEQGKLAKYKEFVESMTREANRKITSAWNGSCHRACFPNLNARPRPYDRRYSIYWIARSPVPGALR